MTLFWGLIICKDNLQNSGKILTVTVFYIINNMIKNVNGQPDEEILYIE